MNPVHVRHEKIAAAASGSDTASGMCAASFLKRAVCVWTEQFKRQPRRRRVPRPD